MTEAHMRFPLLGQVLLRQIVHLSTWLADRYERAHSDPERDRGANVVETIMIVAGFAAIAGVVVLAVKGKVNSWINQIP